MGNKSCTTCGVKNVKHSIAHTQSGITEYLCCRCYVLAGNSPSDWHRDCMSVYKEKAQLLRDTCIL